MFWKTFGWTHMRSINHLYNACHIKKVTIWLWTSECVCCVKVGLISGQPPRFLLPPPSIYLGGPYMPAGACLNASWRVAAALFHGPHLHLLGRCQGRIWRTHSDICEVGVSDFRFWQKKTSELCFERHCPSWDNLTESHPWKRESAAVFLLVCFWSGCTCWANSWNPCVRNAGWPTACNPPGPWDKPLDTHSWKTKAGCRAELDRAITKMGKVSKLPSAHVLTLC